MRPIESHEAHPVLWNLLTINGMGYGFEFASDRDTVIVRKVNGVKVEFTLQEMMCNDVEVFKTVAQRALAHKKETRQPKRQKVIRKRVR